MKYKVAIIGPESVITGFSVLGVQSFPAETAESAAEALADIVAQTNSAMEDGDKYGVVLMIEDLLRKIPEKEYKILTKNVLPSVVAVPGTNGSTGYMTQRLRDFTIRAIGSDIM